MSQTEKLPPSIKEILDGIPQRYIEEYLSERKGIFVLGKTKRDLKAENAGLDKEAAQLREELRNFTEGEGC